jgi:hypothetical protein
VPQKGNETSGKRREAAADMAAARTSRSRSAAPLLTVSQTWGTAATAGPKAINLGGSAAISKVRANAAAANRGLTYRPVTQPARPILSSIQSGRVQSACSGMSMLAL